MLFGLLKRKFFAIERHDEDVSSDTSSEACSPRKKLRVEGPASINEATTQNSQTTCAAGNAEGGQVVDKTGEDQRKEERVRALRAQLKELEERIVALKKQTEREVAMLKELTEETMACMVCKDMTQNPQILQCGHTACYPCLRSWWTRPLPGDEARMIDTVAESDPDVQKMNAPNQGEANSPPAFRARRRHRFRSVALRAKYCPYCNAKATCRPIPELRIRNVTETLNGDLAPLPPYIKARRDARLTRRRDMWRGIFSPDEVLVVGPAPVHHPDPILNNIAQAQFRRRVAEAMTRREKELEEAYQDGRRTGIRETTQQIQREDAPRQAPQPAPRPEMPRPLNELVFGGGDPPLPPAMGPVGGAIPGLPLLVPVPRAAVPHPPVASNNQPI